MLLNNDEHVVIIGGGIAGLSSAWFLQYEGHTNVTLIEKGVDTTMEASGLNSGLIRHYHPNKHVRSELLRSIQLLSSFQDRYDTSFFERSPSIWLFRSDAFEELDQNAHDFQSYNKISPASVPSHFRPENNFGRIWVSFPQDGLLDSVKLGERLKRDLLDSGVDVRTSTQLLDGKKTDNAWELSLVDGRVLTADRIVNAAGVWANIVGNRLGLEPVSFEPVRRHLFLSDQVFVPESHSYFMDQNNRFFFRRTEDGTLISYCDELPVDPADPDETEYPIDHLDNVIGGSYPKLNLSDIDRYWSGKYAMTPDRKPIIKRDDQFDSVVWATGLNDFGMSYGLRCGEQVMNQFRPHEYVHEF